MKKLNDVRVGILKIPVTRIILLILSDMIAILLSSVLSLYVRYEFKFMDVKREFWEAVLEAYFPNVVITLIIFYIFRYQPHQQSGRAQLHDCGCRGSGKCYFEGN